MSALEPVTIRNLRIARPLYDLVQSEIAPGTGLDSDEVWTSLGAIVEDLGPENRRLLEVRARHEQEIDAWHQDRARERANQALDPHAYDPPEYKNFLLEIGYLLPEDGPFTITTADVDPEISSIAGPQLVVPVDNARYALNAANARWGSLYDALYGTDVIGEEDGAERETAYNPVRGSRVVEWTERFLDEVVSLEEGLYAEVIEFLLESNEDLTYQDPSGEALTLPGRSLLLGRPPRSLTAQSEGSASDGAIRNSRAGSVYIAKPKMHGPEEVAFTVVLFGRVEQALGMLERTLKIGIMDEERQTTVNLKACIRAASDRVIFINTGFLDRTGDQELPVDAGVRGLERGRGDRVRPPGCGADR